MRRLIRAIRNFLNRDKKGKVGRCKLCGAKVAYCAAVFCGAACSARYEGGAR